MNGRKLGRKVLYESTERFPKTGQIYMASMKITEANLIYRDYGGNVSIDDGMDLPEELAWIATPVGKLGLLERGVGYVFDIQSKHKMGEIGFEFYPIQERNLTIKRGILKGIMEYDKTIRGSILKEDAR